MLAVFRKAESALRAARARERCETNLPVTQSKERTETVPIDLLKPHDPFVHVHVCVHCGNAARQEEFEDGAQTTGIYPCPKCGVESPLNIEIRAVDTLEKESGKTD